MKTLIRLFAVGLAGLLTVGAFAQPKGRSTDDPDQKELYNYVLSMDKIQKIANATIAMSEYAKRHPEATADSGDAKSLDDTVRKLQKYPEVVSILSKNGVAPRDYAVGMFTLLQASIAVGSKKSGLYKEYPPKMLQLVSKANLDFVDQHYEEIQKLTASMQPKDQ
jgi:hypothetical protein